MYAINTRYLLPVLRAQIIIGLVILSVGKLQAQKFRGNYNFLNYQQKPYYFGITLASNSSSFKPFRSRAFLESEDISIIESVGGPGFNLGIVTNLKIGDYFDFRLLPTLSFAERNINYSSRAYSRIIEQRRVESVFVEIPFHLRYKSAPFKDKRAFLIAGVKYAFDVASDSRAANADDLVKIAPTDFSLEYGAGMQFFFPYFIFSPEIKISHGIGNTLIYNNSIEESTVLEKLLSRTFTIAFHFEG